MATLPLMLFHDGIAPIIVAVPVKAIVKVYTDFRSSMYESTFPGSSVSVKACRSPVAPTTTTTVGFAPGALIRS
jgi:hypothetical protein